MLRPELLLARWNPKETPIAVLSEGCFGESRAKTALGVIRYGGWPVCAVIDSTQAGKTVEQVTGIACPAPVVDSFDEALKHNPRALLLGTAPPGGLLPPEWREVIRQAIRAGLHIFNGLHEFLNDDADLTALARRNNVILWDVRNFQHYVRPDWETIARQRPRPEGTHVITLVGSDCSVGKMHAALELRNGALNRGIPAGFVATGQTGILIEGRGLPLDAVIGDFMAGYTESCLLETIQNSDKQPRWVFVEGQGSLMHPAFSGVTLGLLHGSNPDAMILCHTAGLQKIKGGYELAIPPLSTLIEMYETAAAWLRPTTSENALPKAKVAGLAINTSALSETQARDYLARTQAGTGLPATDPVRFGVEPLLERLSSQLAGGDLPVRRAEHYPA